MTTITIDNIEKMGEADILSLGKCFCALGSLPKDLQSIPEFVGYNNLSGYSYIVLESGLTILSILNHEVEYMIYNYEKEEEIFFDTLQEYQEYTKQ